MFVKHLQEYLWIASDGKRGNAISNARIYGNKWSPRRRRTEVQDSNIIGQNSIRVVLKPPRQKLIIAPPPLNRRP